MAWTGPTPPLSNLRRTEQSLLQVITSARRELWVVSFAAYRVRSICEALVEAGRRCTFRLVLESESESDGRLTSGGLDDMPPEVRQHCQLFVSPREKRVTDERGRFGLLHAKCEVADSELLFTGSANLTESAFELNMEVGALIRGREAATVFREQLEWLRNGGQLDRAGWPASSPRGRIATCAWSLALGRTSDRGRFGDEAPPASRPTSTA